MRTLPQVTPALAGLRAGDGVKTVRGGTGPTRPGPSSAKVGRSAPPASRRMGARCTSQRARPGRHAPFQAPVVGNPSSLKARQNEIRLCLRSLQEKDREEKGSGRTAPIASAVRSVSTVFGPPTETAVILSTLAPPAFKADARSRRASSTAISSKGLRLRCTA